MGSRVSTPDDKSSSPAPEIGLGDLLAGRLSDVRIDAVDAVRDVRDPE